MSFEPKPGQSCSDVRDEANVDRHSGRYAESLQKHEWYFEHSRNEMGMGGVRLSFALGDWLELASDYTSNGCFRFTTGQNRKALP